MSNNNILVAIDSGRESIRALDAAIDLAKRLRTTLEIAHAVAPAPPPLPADDPDAPEAHAGAALLAEAAARARAAGLEPVTHLELDTVVLALLQLIEEREPMLVVVGSHGRHGVSRALLGSVSDALARRAKVPVLIVPSPERQPQAARAAWSCAQCGHILADTESTFVCARCGATGGNWISASMAPGPADAGQPSVGESVAPDLAEPQTRETLGLFSTSPPGTEGYDVNPELRVRY
jgi:nucleotide-binding universal stress UspA family protein